MSTRRFLAIATAVVITGCTSDRPSSSPSTSGASAASAAVPLTGEQVFQKCVVCHQANGAGLPGGYRSLVGSVWATGPADRAIALLLHGVRGPIRDKGVAYTIPMLPYGNGQPMTDQEVAAVLTHVRTSWGNVASPVTAADVARVRAATAGRTTPWTERELEAMRE